MKRIFLCAAALLAAARVCAAVETGRPYLKRPAETPAALAQQVITDQQLLLRYAKHFRAKTDDVKRAVTAAREDTLPPGEYTVWLTGRDGLRYPTRQQRPRPTPAFRMPQPDDASAVAWLERGTGNPIVPFRPVEEVEIVSEPAPNRIVTVEEPREVLVPAGPNKG
ncbi:MAG TPA: hypothetical protein VGM37_16780 [Armatimonadota bacterium]|jgi:hypothetical protein